MAVETTRRPEAAVEGVHASVYQVPTDEPESDGTMEWSSTTIVVVEADAGDGRSASARSRTCAPGALGIAAALARREA